MKIASIFNDLALRWDKLTPEQKRFHIQLLHDLFAHTENNFEEVMARWQSFAKENNIKGNVSVSALQIINPTTGKGANRAKASELTIGNQDSFWLLELLKFRGFMEAAAPMVIKDSDDRKTYVIQPRVMQLSLLQGVMKKFRAVFWTTTAVKLDILASLRFAQVLVQQYRMLYEQESTLEEWMPREIASLAQKFDVTFYKYLGSAHATMNLSTIGLPTWLPPLDDLEQVKTTEALLNEHVQLVRNIRNSKGEEGSEEYELFRFYRDFLSGNDLSPFWRFTTLYSSYLISTREKNRYIQQLTTKGLEQLLMNHHNQGHKLTSILQKDGFKSIANAIRQATVGAQYRKAQQNDRTYDIHYGLGQDLMRKAHYPKEFIAALCAFLQQYNAETARVEEKLATKLGHKLEKRDRSEHKLRMSVASQDINDIVELVDQHGSELIASMLVAYGYAFDSNIAVSSGTKEHENMTLVAATSEE